jgi:hypothetical protein
VFILEIEHDICGKLFNVVITLWEFRNAIKVHPIEHIGSSLKKGAQLLVTISSPTQI